MFLRKPFVVLVFSAIVMLVLISCNPVVTDFEPKEGSPGDEVTITGNRFKENPEDNTVKFKETPAPEILEATKNLIKVIVPEGVETGPISVTTSQGTGISQEDFEVIDGKEWTFMVYLDADNNLESAGIDDFLEMAAVGSSSDINIVVQMDRITGEDNSFGDWTGTRRFLINKDDAPDKSEFVDLEEQNMGAPDTLQDFVVWAVQTYPAKRYALSIWNHGNGWKELVETRLLTRARAAETPGEEAVTLRAIASDDTDNDILYMKELQGALEGALEQIGGQMKLDVVGFDACLMGMIEVCYAVRNVANNVVGSEWLEPGDGWPYDTILADLIGAPTVSGSDLSQNIVTKYGSAYGSGITQSSVDMSNIDDVVSKIDTFADVMTSEWDALQNARNNTIQYHPAWSPSTWGIDLWQFADNVYNRVTSETIKNAAQALKEALDTFVTNEKHSTDKDGSHGVAIYFPPTKTDFDNDPEHTGYMQDNTVFPVDFVQSHNWDEFLQRFYENIGS